MKFLGRSTLVTYHIFTHCKEVDRKITVLLNILFKIFSYISIKCTIYLEENLALNEKNTVLLIESVEYVENYNLYSVC